MATGFEWKNVTLPGANTKDPRLNSTGAAASGYEKALKTLTTSLKGGFDAVDETRDNRAIDAFNQEIAKAKTGKDYGNLQDSDFLARVAGTANPGEGQRYLDDKQRKSIISNFNTQKGIADATDDRNLDKIFQGATSDLGQYEGKDDLSKALSERITEYGGTSQDVADLTKRAQGLLFDNRNEGTVDGLLNEIQSGTFADKLSIEAMNSKIAAADFVSPAQKTMLMNRLTAKSAAGDEARSQEIDNNILGLDFNKSKTDVLKDLDAILPNNLSLTERNNYQNQVLSMFGNKNTRKYQSIANAASTPEGVKQYGTAEEAVKKVSEQLRAAGATEDEITQYTANIPTYWSKVAGPTTTQQSNLDVLKGDIASTVNAGVKANQDEYVNEIIKSGIVGKNYKLLRAGAAKEGENATTTNEPLKLIQEVEPLIGSNAAPAVQGIIEFANSQNVTLTAQQIKDIIGLSMNADYTPGTGVNYDFDDSPLNRESMTKAEQLIIEAAKIQNDPSLLANIDRQMRLFETQGNARIAQLNASNLAKVTGYNRGANANPVGNKSEGEGFELAQINSGQGIREAQAFINSLPTETLTGLMRKPEFRKYKESLDAMNTAKLTEAAKAKAASEGRTFDDPRQHNFPPSPKEEEVVPKESGQTAKAAQKALLEQMDKRKISDSTGISGRGSYRPATKEEEALEEQLQTTFRNLEQKESLQRRLEVLRNNAKNSGPGPEALQNAAAIKTLEKALEKFQQQ